MSSIQQYYVSVFHIRYDQKPNILSTRCIRYIQHVGQQCLLIEGGLPQELQTKIANEALSALTTDNKIVFSISVVRNINCRRFSPINSS